MTDFKPLKDRVWLSVKDNDVEKVESACDELMKRAVEDMFRIGWEIYPKKIDDVYDLLDDVSNWCHERWIEAMQRGDAPNEDVSPGEGPLLVKKIIQEEIAKCGKEGTDSGNSQDMVQD